MVEAVELHRAEAALRVGAEGIGLLRSEFLFLRPSATTLPRSVRRPSIRERSVWFGPCSLRLAPTYIPISVSIKR